MRARCLWFWSASVLSPLATSACSDIIGISGYRIDTDLDAADASGSGGAGPAGGESAAGSPPTQAGAPATTGGELTGGAASDGSGGSLPMDDVADGGARLSTPSCESALDCDDGIDCTEDVCDALGACQHAVDDSRCDRFKCQSCEAGVGCVAGQSTSWSLLTDPGFDGTHDDWVESSQSFDDQNIFPDQSAQTPPRVARFGPAPLDATQQEYADLLQDVQVPEGTVALRLTGYYRLSPGRSARDEDYVVAGLYETGHDEPRVQFHVWRGDGDAKAAWTPFTFDAARADLVDMGGQAYTLDLVAYSWETVFSFDSLSLSATVCQSPAR
jgi:hypothetical protein